MIEFAIPSPVRSVTVISQETFPLKILNDHYVKHTELKLRAAHELNYQQIHLLKKRMVAFLDF